jgi:hypothetical protein
VALVVGGGVEEDVDRPEIGDEAVDGPLERRILARVRLDEDRARSCPVATISSASFCDRRVGR